MNPSRNTIVHLLALAALVVLVSWPVLVHGAPDLAHDTALHARWDKAFAEELWAGDWYPRWLPDLNGGLGSPVFFFRPAFSAYASSIFEPFLAGRDPGGLLQTGWGCALSLFFSGVATYFWLRFRATPDAALFGAAVFVIAPYHLAIDLYNRGAVQELWAFVSMPLVMLAVDGIIACRWWGVGALAVSYASLLLGHVGIAVCFSAVPVAGAFFLSERGRRIRNTLATAAGMALGAALVAVYVVPAKLEEGNIHVGSLLNDFTHYEHWFLFQVPSLLDYKTRLLVLTLTTVAYLGAAFWLCWRNRSAQLERRAVLFYGGVGIAAFYFMTQASYPFWRYISILELVPFPYRFAAVLSLAVAALSAFAFPYFRQRQSRSWLYVASVFVLGWMGANAWSASQAFSVWRAVPQERTRPYPLRRDTVWPETSQDMMGRGLLEKFLAAHPARALEFTGQPRQQAGHAAVVSWQPRRIVLQVDSPEQARLTINHFYYPGWSGRIGASGPRVPTGPTPGGGLIRLDVPPGHYSLIVELGREWPERAGIAISLGSLLIVLGIATAGAINARRTSGSPVEASDRRS